VDLRAVVAKLVAMAKAGDLAAAHELLLVLAFLYGKDANQQRNPRQQKPTRALGRTEILWLLLPRLSHCTEAKMKRRSGQLQVLLANVSYRLRHPIQGAMQIAAIASRANELGSGMPITLPSGVM
jgi:hypothetical protein